MSSPERAPGDPILRSRHHSPIDEPVRGGHPGAPDMALPGAEQLRRQLTGTLPEPPLSRLLGIRLAAAADGTARFEMPLSGWLADGHGRIGPGPLTIPADGAMACAVMSTLPAATPFTTSELTMHLLRLPPPGGTLTASARMIAVRPPVMLSDVTVADETGALIAHGTSLLITTPPVAFPGPASAMRYPEPAGGDPDPWQRPAPEPGEVSPIACLTGLEVESADDGAAQLAIPASPWFCAQPAARVQGGIVALLADSALGAAVDSQLPSGEVYTPIELKLNLLRPLVSDGRPARAQARVVHRGRRLAVATATVNNADGQRVAVASGSGLLGAPR
jgi:uncharacterized protein (TIGR00369 family)